MYSQKKMYAFWRPLFGLLLFTCLTAHGAPSSVRCASSSDGRWQVLNKLGKVVGEAVSSRQTCESMVATQNGNLACIWNGRTVQVYNLENGLGLGAQDKNRHFLEISACAKSIANQLPQSPFVCAWNGDSWAPHLRISNVVLLKGKGWRTLQECVDLSAKASFQNLICSWQDASVLTHASGKSLSRSFQDTKDCAAFVSILKRSNHASDFSDKVIENSRSGDISAFKNGTPSENVGFPMKKCEVPSHRNHLTKSDGNYLNSECTPDTLYSWGNYLKLEWFLSNLPDKENWSGKLLKPLFTVSSAAATFAYGNMPIRIKLKPHTRFRLLVNPPENICENDNPAWGISKTETLNTVFSRLVLRPDGLSFLEHIICGKDVIESWSYGTKEHYDEVIRDYTWMTTKNYNYWEAYVKYSGVDGFMGINVDPDLKYVNFSPADFKSKIETWRNLSSQGFGQVMMRKNDNQTQAQHFKTAWPIYFNPE